jgi:hypothetical protein
MTVAPNFVVNILASSNPIPEVDPVMTTTRPVSGKSTSAVLVAIGGRANGRISFSQSSPGCGADNKTDRATAKAIKNHDRNDFEDGIIVTAIVLSMNGRCV